MMVKLSSYCNKVFEDKFSIILAKDKGCFHLIVDSNSDVKYEVKRINADS